MNKKILISLSVIAAVAAIAIGGTVAYFSDTETSTGNTFTAGVLDLTVDDYCTYNGDPQDFCIWGLKNLGEGDLFFNYPDVKPGDWGENTVSFHVDNEAWLCAGIFNLEYDDNSCPEPEDAEDEPGVPQYCGTDPNAGELQDYLTFTIWRDYDCDNVLDGEEPVLYEGPAEEGYWPIADSTTGDPLQPGVMYCLGVMWSVPPETGNIIQSDSLKGDITFYAEQARNNPEFTCILQ